MDSWGGIGDKKGSKGKSLYGLAKQVLLLSGNSKSRAAPQGKRGQQPRCKSHTWQRYCQPEPNPIAPKGGKQDRPKTG